MNQNNQDNSIVALNLQNVLAALAAVGEFRTTKHNKAALRKFDEVAGPEEVATSYKISGKISAELLTALVTQMEHHAQVYRTALASDRSYNHLVHESQGVLVELSSRITLIYRFNGGDNLPFDALYGIESTIAGLLEQ